MTKALWFAVPGALDTPTGGYGYDRQLMAELAARGHPVTHLPLPDGFPFPDTDAIAATRRAFAALPDGATVIVDGLAFGALPDVMTAEAARLRLVALIHHPLGDETGLDPARREDLWARETAALRAAAAVLCTSPATARRLIADFGVDAACLTVAPPGTARAPRRRAGIGPLRILSIGSLIPRKRHDILIAALATLRDRPWQARIIGSPDLDPACARDLAARIAAAGLDTRLRLTGAVTDTRAALQDADIFALASEYEGYGMAFAEAMVQGVPIVACRAGAIADLVPEAAGALVPPGDAVAYAAALARLLDDPARRAAAGDAAYRAGQALPDWPQTGAIVAAALARLEA